jgi:transcriptional regulator with XRE-family HTH domain
MEFHEKLQTLRKEKGWTQEALAEKLYVSRTAISKWESGRGYPNIDSLRAIARVFSVTVDELLSTDEVLTIATEEQKQTKTHFCDLGIGVLDLCAMLLLFLPLFATRAEGVIRAVTLLGLDGIRTDLTVLYWLTVCGMVLTGVCILALQNVQSVAWSKCKVRISLSLGVLATVLFTVSLQPYAALYAFVLLALKVLILIRKRA